MVVPQQFLLPFLCCIASFAIAGCESAEQRASRLSAAQEAAREARAITRACVKLDEHWSLDPGYAPEGGVDRCVEASNARLRQFEGPADKLRRAKEIGDLQAAACEIDPDSEKC